MNLTNRQVKMQGGDLTFSEIGGSDECLLMLHGFSFREGLIPLARLLSPHFRVIIPDLPFSTNNEYLGEHSLKSYVALLIDLVSALELTNISVFGNSIGATLGLMCCLDNPNLFDKLVVRCPLWSPVQLPAYLKMKPLVSLHGFISSNRTYAASFIKLFYWLSARMSPIGETSPGISGMDQLPGSTPGALNRIDPTVFSKFLGTLVSVEIQKQLKMIPNETLILWGENDNLIPPSWGEYQSQLQPAAWFLVLEGEYHNISTSDITLLAGIITDFVSGTG
jgi:pimeloyl-ACP methyl ester carboxylesterase